MLRIVQMLYIKHDNVNHFVGVCTEPPNICVAMAYAEKGSLQNVLFDSQLEIDWDFRMSLAMDVCKVRKFVRFPPSIQRF